MPTYEYHCPACNNRFEIWQKMTDEPLSVCNECGGHIRRVIFPPGIVFKGSGFYKTDHGNGAVAASNGHATKGESESEGKTTAEKTSGESKSAEKSTSNGSKNATEQKVPTSAGTT